MSQTFIQTLCLMLISLLFSIVVGFLVALIIWPLWNWLMPAIFSLPQITYIQSWGLSVLLTSLFRLNTSVSYNQKQIEDFRK